MFPEPAINEDLPKHFIEIYLRPGDFYWGGETTRIQTLLGSCIALTFWHPELKQGGMCHFMLPGDGPRSASATEKNSGRYGTEAMALFFERIRRLGTRPSEYVIKMFGGGNMFSGVANARDAMIGDSNIAFARRFLDEHELKIANEDVGGSVHRKLFFDIWSGHVWLKRTAAENLSVPRPGRSA
ncbi:MAG: chemotaxis protein CheD [bacterium]|nr:chemotaxis protein CheD [bacterium]